MRLKERRMRGKGQTTKVLLLLLGQGVSGPEEVWVYMARGILGVPCLEAQFSLAFKHQSQYIWFSLKIDEIKLWERVNIVLPPSYINAHFLGN